MLTQQKINNKNNKKKEYELNCWVISRQPYANKSGGWLKLAITCKLSFDSPCTNDNLHFRSVLLLLLLVFFCALLYTTFVSLSFVYTICGSI